MSTPDNRWKHAVIAVDDDVRLRRGKSSHISGDAFADVNDGLELPACCLRASACAHTF
jgi:hypothetical protein